VVRYTSIRAMISIEVEMGWKIHQMDVKTTFFNDIIEEEVYIEQLEGFEVHGRDSHVCRLRRVLYGLKQVQERSIHGLKTTWRGWYSPRVRRILTSTTS
jgi:hypothetical protein